jgi:heat shock protein HtpX
MPLTFIDIERQKNWRIGLYFLLLLFLYFVAALLAGALFFPLAISVASRFLVFAGATALLVAGIHFFFSAWDAVSTIISALNAQPPDPHDDVHRTLANVVQELHVATGNKRRIQCVVIPSLSMNALAVSDLKGEAVIGITEGLLSRLTRPQLESVIAHEAHHILSGDCLETTVAASLFGTFNSAVEKLGDATQGRAFSPQAFFLNWLLLKPSYLLSMFISREREYRADAAAVRMTRNPIALAETLYLLSRSWRGAGFIGSGYEMLCIVNPNIAMLDESEGFWADLLSTHPPLAKRIEVLLAMARVSVTELEQLCEKRPGTVPADCEPRYYALNPQQQWQGPFNLAELGSQPWLSPLTWIMTGDKNTAERAWKEPLLDSFFASRLLHPEQTVSGHACPACHQPLVRESYEGTEIEQCRFCSGVLVESARIPRIIARTGRDHPCSDRINSLAKAAVSENLIRHRPPFGSPQKAITLLACPQCGNPMLRAFYSLAHLIEVDRCDFCSLTWFDRDELQMLQCLIANNIVPHVEVREYGTHEEQAGLRG